MAGADKILVIGASGQIGSELIPELRKIYGASNVVIADLREPQDELVHEGPHEKLDVLDAKALGRILDKYNVKIVYHLAALLSAVAEKNPRKAWDVNMEGLFNVLDAAVEKKLDKVFWPSSIAVFGKRSPKQDTPQYTITDPSTVYGISKLAGERWCKYYFRNYGLDVRSLRYPGLISYKAPPGGGTTDYAVDMYYKAVQGEPYTCFLEKGTYLPMMYMPDAIRATIELMDAGLEKVSLHDAYNISGMSFAPEELVAEIHKEIPVFQVSYEPDYRQKIADTWPDTIDDQVAQRDWGWKPEYDCAAMTKDMLAHLYEKLRVGTH